MTILRLVSDQADPTERGKALGKAGVAQIHENVAGYERLFAAVNVDPANLRPYGERAEAEIEQWAPELHRELLGVAQGAGIPSWQVGMLNARTEILATVGATGEGECSTAVFVPETGPPRTIQTWDWHDELDATKAVVTYVARNGHQVRYFTETGILGKIGLNGAGVGVHFNILSHSSDGDGIGVPVHTVARRVLDEATTVDEAIDIASTARVSASTVLTVVDFDGRRSSAVCIELSPARTAVVRPDDDGYLLHTNHFLDPDLAAGDLSAKTASTYPRLKHLAARRELLGSSDPLRRVEALHVHDADGAPVCCHPLPNLPFHERWRTLLTIGLELDEGILGFHDGGPCTTTTESWQTF